MVLHGTKILISLVTSLCRMLLKISEPWNVNAICRPNIVISVYIDRKTAAHWPGVLVYAETWRPPQPTPAIVSRVFHGGHPRVVGLSLESYRPNGAWNSWKCENWRRNGVVRVGKQKLLANWRHQQLMNGIHSCSFIRKTICLSNYWFLEPSKYRKNTC